MKTFPTSVVWCFGILFISVSLITTGSSEVQVVGSADPVVALAGDDIILPCSLKPTISDEEMAVEWTGLYLRTRNIHLYRQGRDSNEDQFPSYKGRTSMFHEELKNGNVSLKLTRVTLSDAGRYRCFLPTLTSQVKETTVQLIVESSEVVGSADPVVALAGDDVILPCSLKPSVGAEDMTVEWTGLYLKTRNVHLYRQGRDSNVEQFPSYRGRTSMFHEELKNGNVSLKLTRVTLSDAGSYMCFIPTLTGQVKETTVQLFVGAISQPVISIDGTKGWGVALKCESGGWFPEPEMEWLDSSGTILPADGPEKHRDEDLYTVRRHVSVNKTDTNRFTCRVQQQEINHLKETEIHVPDDLFPKSHVVLIVGLSIAVAVAVLAAIGAYKWRKHTEGEFNLDL
ncbi:butyrophilin subfamily 3 member A2-like isoform X2 [Salvelinus alpinus]|uniref:butyrophilin subfamily 3 member A2-like isoform X2 n=1 Tax=Salvelinus alpinus TaxID=8036 RepID=UPI0039FD1312